MSSGSAGISGVPRGGRAGGSTWRCGSASDFPAPARIPLFSRLFVLATSVNFLPAALGGENAASWSLLGVLHLVFINRIRIARAFAATQRAQDLERFEALRREQEQAPDSPQPHTDKVI